MKYKTLITLLLMTTTIWSQDISTILSSITENNTQLKALRQAKEAKKLANRTGVYIENPEFQFHYLWGSPQVMGQRTDVSLMQSIDFPIVYKYQKKIVNIKNQQADLEFIKQQKVVLFRSNILLVRLIYTNALQEYLNTSMKHSQNIAGSYQKKYDAGEATIIAYNKAHLNLLSDTKGFESNEIERDVLLNELKTLNGGEEIQFIKSYYEKNELLGDFEQWYAEAEKNNPILNWLKQEVVLSKQEINLTKAQNLPKFQAGYMMEKAADEQFQGVVFGMSIPLWENKNTVKYAKANALAVESYAADSKLVFYNHLESLYQKAKKLQTITADYRKKIDLYEPSIALAMALDKGQITLLEYFSELSFHLENRKKLLEMEKELNLTLVELYQFM